MMRRPVQKLPVRRETVRVLEVVELGRVVGGDTQGACTQLLELPDTQDACTQLLKK